MPIGHGVARRRDVIHQPIKRTLRRLDIQRNTKLNGINPPQQHMDIGNRQRPAKPITRRPRVCPRARRSNTKHPGMIKRTNRPAARRNRYELGAWAQERCIPNRLLTRQRDDAILNTTDIRACAAHVDADRLGKARG